MTEQFNDILTHLRTAIDANQYTLDSINRTMNVTERGARINVNEIDFSPGYMPIPSTVLNGQGVFDTEINNKNVSVSRVKLNIGSFYNPHFHEDAAEVAVLLQGQMLERLSDTTLVPGGVIFIDQDKLHSYEALTDVEYLVVFIKLKKI